SCPESASLGASGGVGRRDGGLRASSTATANCSSLRRSPIHPVIGPGRRRQLREGGRGIFTSTQSHQSRSTYVVGSCRYKYEVTSYIRCKLYLFQARKHYPGHGLVILYGTGG